MSRIHREQQDSDFEVCLTSEEYSRILSKHTQSETLKAEKLDLQKEIETLAKKISSLEQVNKEKDREIDEISVQCLKLKKVKLIQEDKILCLKQEMAGNKERDLSQLERSILENKEMKEHKLHNQGIICELRQELETLRDCLKHVTEQNKTTTLQLYEQIKVIQHTITKQSQENDELRVRCDQSQKRAAETQCKLMGKDRAYNQLSVEYEEKSAMLEQLQARYNKDIDNCENTKRSLLQQMALLKTEEEALFKEKDASAAKLAEDIVKITGLLGEANQKIGQFLDQDSGTGNVPQEGRFCGKLLQALRWIKEGTLNVCELENQIQGMFGLEKEYQNIIALRGQNVEMLTAEVRSLQQRNNQLNLRNSLIHEEFQESSSLVRTLSDIKVKSEENTQQSEIFVLKEEVQKLTMKLKKVQVELDQSVKAYNYTISDSQVTHQKQIALLTEVQSEIEALRLARKFQGQALGEAVDNIYRQMNRAKTRGQTLTPDSVLVLLKSNINKLVE